VVNLPDRRSPPARPARPLRGGGLALLAFLAALALPGAAAAQNLYNWTVGVMGGAGGSPDVKPGSRNYGNFSWQVEGLALTEPRTFLGLRLGHLALGDKSTLFGSRGASASKTVAGGVLGLTGDFRASRRISVLVELSAHYIDIRNAHVFAMAHGGLAFHF
jgi:hypothetical protein